MQIEEEAEMDRQKFLMDEGEKEEMVAALKKKWEVVHREYQTLTHKNKLDSLGMKEKFESCERELKQLERDIEKLSKNYIFVDTTAPSSYFWLNSWNLFHGSLSMSIYQLAPTQNIQIKDMYWLKHLHSFYFHLEFI